MSVSENLIPNESIVLEVKKHWIAPVRDSLPAAGLILISVLLMAFKPQFDGFLSFITTLLVWIQWGLLIAGIAWIVYNIVVWRTAEFAVTTLRVLRYEGFLQRRTSETLLSAVSDVKLDVGMIGKSLGYGDVKIMTMSGDAGADNFKSITQATEFRNAMMAQKMAEQTAARAPAGRRRRRRRRSPAPPPPRPSQHRRTRPRTPRRLRRRLGGRDQAPRRPARPGPPHPRGVRGEEGGDPRPHVTRRATAAGPAPSSNPGDARGAVLGDTGRATRSAATRWRRHASTIHQSSCRHAPRDTRRITMTEEQDHARRDR